MLALTQLAGFGSGGGGPLAFTLDGTAQNNSTASTQVYTMVAAIPVGALIIVVGGSTSPGGGSLSSVSDSKGNTYAVNSSQGNGSNTIAGVAMAPCTVALAAADTITLTWSGSATGHGAAVGQITNPLTNTSAAFDVQNSAQGTSSTPSATTATLNQVNEIAIGAVASNNTTTGTQDAAFTTIANLTFAAASKLLIAGYKIVAATTAVTYAPTLPASVAWAEALATYKGQ